MWLFTTAFLSLFFLHHSLADLSLTHVIDCNGPLPPREHFGEISPSYIKLFGRDAYSFCRSNYQIGFSMGCFCNMTNSVECTKDAASLISLRLWNIPELRRYCLDHCSCVKPEDIPWRNNFDEGIRQAKLEEQSLQRHKDWVASNKGRPFRGGHRRTGSSRSGSSSGSGNNQRFSSADDGYSSISSLDGQCIASCSGMEKCSAMGGGCKCVGSVVPYSRLWTGFCATDWSSLMGKRGVDDTACLCNATYVSKSCCGTVDGLLWEAPELNLGTAAISDNYWGEDGKY